MDNIEKGREIYTVREKKSGRQTYIEKRERETYMQTRTETDRQRNREREREIER